MGAFIDRGGTVVLKRDRVVKHRRLGRNTIEVSLRSPPPEAALLLLQGHSERGNLLEADRAA